MPMLTISIQYIIGCTFQFHWKCSQYMCDDTSGLCNAHENVEIWNNNFSTLVLVKATLWLNALWENKTGKMIHRKYYRLTYSQSSEENKWRLTSNAWRSREKKTKSLTTSHVMVEVNKRWYERSSQCKYHIHTSICVHSRAE